MLFSGFPLLMLISSHRSNERFCVVASRARSIATALDPVVGSQHRLDLFQLVVAPMFRGSHRVALLEGGDLGVLTPDVKLEFSRLIDTDIDADWQVRHERAG